MIALVITFQGFGLLGLAAYGAVIVVGGMIIAPFYWGYKKTRVVASVSDPR